MADINAFCHEKNALQKLDKNRVIIGGRFKMQIISIKEKKILNEIETSFLIWAICVIENKKIFICGGVSPYLLIFNSENYENLGKVENSHNGRIRGISPLNNGNIISGAEDNKTKIWKIIYMKS